MENVNFFSYNSLFSSRLRDLLNKKNISMQALSVEIGVSRQAISQYCDGSTVPNADKLLKIADYFGVSLDYLVGRTDTPTTDMALRAVCDYTGLSEYSVRVLKQFKELSAQKGCTDCTSVEIQTERTGEIKVDSAETRANNYFLLLNDLIPLLSNSEFLSSFYELTNMNEKIYSVIEERLQIIAKIVSPETTREDELFNQLDENIEQVAELERLCKFKKFEVSEFLNGCISDVSKLSEDNEKIKKMSEKIYKLYDENKQPFLQRHYYFYSFDLRR